jgi:hypothetical protein
MRKLFTTGLICLWIVAAHAQDSLTRMGNRAPINKWYGMSGAQLIFSFGNVNEGSAPLPNVLRFTCFFHIQRQFHYDFGKAFGMYTGLSLINVGFINKLGDPYDATLKQRSYSLGIPLGFKLGNMPKGDYLAVGAEGECMFAYKQKILYDGNKTVFNDNLFSSQYVNLFNPSAFVELRLHSGAYIRFKYYLLNFLVNRTETFTLPGTGIMETYTPEKSALYYISVGYLFKKKHKQHLTKDDV